MEEKKFCMKSRTELDEIRKQQASKKASVNEAETLEDKANKIGNDKKALLKRLKEGISVLKNEYKKEFKDYTFDFDKKTLTSKSNPELVLKWINNGRTSEGSVSLHKDKSESKIRKSSKKASVNEISDETVYNAVAKAHSVAKDGKTIQRAVRMHNKGLNREFAKNGLPNPKILENPLTDDEDRAKEYARVNKEYSNKIASRMKSESKINEISDETVEKAYKKSGERMEQIARQSLKGNISDKEFKQADRKHDRFGTLRQNRAFRKMFKAQQESLLNEKSTKIPSDLIDLVTQISMDYGIKFDPATKRYAVEDDETGDILVTGTANTIREWAVENGAKKPMKDLGFKIDGAETLDQVYRRNWNKAMQGMNRNESLTASKALAMSKAILEGEEELLYYPVGKMEIGLPLEAAKELSMGGDAQPAVDYWKQQPEVKNQLNKLTDEQIDSVKEYLDMDDEEFANLSKEDKLDYIIWIVGGYIYDEWYENQNESFNIPNTTQSLKKDYLSGKITAPEVAKELAKANLTPYVVSDKEALKYIGVNESKINEISDELAQRVANKREMNQVNARRKYDDAWNKYSETRKDGDYAKASRATKELDTAIRKREKSAKLMNKRQARKIGESKINESKDYQFDNIVISIYGEPTENSKVVEEKMSGFGMQNLEIINVYNSEDEAVQDHLARIKAGEQPDPLVYETQETIDYINKHNHLPSLDADDFDAEYSAWAD